MKAIILAAGEGKRIRSITDRPKCLLPIGDTSFLERSVGQLRYAGVSEIWIITGYQHLDIYEALDSRVCHCLNHQFATTNSIYSLTMGLSVLDTLSQAEDTIIMNGDIYFHVGDLISLVENDGEFVLLIGPQEMDQESTKIKLRGEAVVDIGQDIPLNEAAAEFTGICKVSDLLLYQFGLCVRERAIADPNAKWIEAIRDIIQSGHHVEYELAIEPWIEVDTPEDYERAKELSA